MPKRKKKEENMSSIALCGCGTVGVGVLQILEANENYQIIKILVRDIDKDRGLSETQQQLLTDDPQEIMNCNADILVEVMGGTALAKRLIEDAISKGKRVVTANKALLAKHPELMNNDGLFFEAAVAGGIPVIRTLQDSMTVEPRAIRGVLNGTCNFILSDMESCMGKTYADSLQLAQKLGYAEASPAADVDGHDAFAKLQILARLAFNAPLTPVRPRGISGVLPIDIAYADDLGCVVRHVCAVESKDDSAVQAFCMPAIVRKKDTLAVMTP